MAKPPRTSLYDALASTPCKEGVEGDIDSSASEHTERTLDEALGLPAVPLREPREFDFGDVPSEALAEIRSLRHAIVVKLTAAIIAVGEDLLRLQELIELHCIRGTWTRFLETGLPFSETSARNYMRAAMANKRFENGATVAEKVSPTGLYEAHSATAEILKEIERRADEGETVTGRDVRKMIYARERSEPGNDALDLSKTAEIDEAHSGTIDQDAHGDSLPLSDPTFEASPADAKSPQTAATELIARLREHFEDGAIAELDDLWQTAGPGTVRALLAM